LPVDAVDLACCLMRRDGFLREREKERISGGGVEEGKEVEMRH